MSREIKFRAWDKFDKRMIVWDECLKNESLIAEIILNTERYTAFEYTGLEDKNKKDIYEHDLVKITYFDWLSGKEQHLQICKVYFKDGCFGFDYGFNKREFLTVNCFEPRSYTFEIVGNIYQNPELLEGAE